MSDAQRVHATAAGDRIAFLRTASDTDGELLEMRVAYVPRAAPPPLHLHPLQEERFEVTAGSLWARIGSSEVTYGPGERFVVPPRTPHTMRPADGGGVELLWQVRPALESEAFFRVAWGLDDGAPASGRLGLLRRVALARRFTREFRVTSPPYPVQRLLFALLGPVATLLGHRMPARGE